MLIKKTGNIVSPKTQLANALLELSEKTTDSIVRKRLLSLKKILSSNDAGADNDERLSQLHALLFSAKEAINLGIDRKCLDTLDRFEHMLKGWQSGPEFGSEKGEKKMNFFQRLSKPARESKKRDEKIEELKSKVFQLEQMSESVALKIENIDKSCDQLKVKAAKLAPGSMDYTNIRSQYNHLILEKKTLSASFQSIQKGLQTNKLYLETLNNAKSSEVVKGLTPASLEDMELDLTKASKSIQESVVLLKEGADLAAEIAQEVFETYTDLNDEGMTGSDFDESVTDLRMSESVYKKAMNSPDSLLDKLNETDPGAHPMKDEVKPE